MATTITQRLSPPYWNSANDDIIYEFDYNKYSISAIGSDGGYVLISPVVALTVDYNVGDYVFIYSTTYVGVYKIIADFGDGEVVIDAPYIGSSTGYYYSFLSKITFNIYKGFQVGEEFPNELPYTLVTSITPSFSLTNTGVSFLNTPYLSVNIRSIAKSLFTISPTFTSGEPDFSLFNAVRMGWGTSGNFTVCNSDHQYNMVLNCGISTAELTLNYLGNGNYLAPRRKPVVQRNNYKSITSTMIYPLTLQSVPTSFNQIVA